MLREKINTYKTNIMLNMNNYTLPAEWQEQFAVQLTWPHEETDWQESDLLEEIEEYFITLAEVILNYQDLIIVAHDEDLKYRITNLLDKDYDYNYTIYICPTNDTWARDHGPITLVNNQDSISDHNSKLIIDFDFNAWGGKFDATLDNEITSTLYEQDAYGHAQYKKPAYLPDSISSYILEGGAIDSNGAGTVLTTSSCVLNSNRNNNLSDQDKINILKQNLNIDHLIVLKNSFLYGDDTDGHTDMIARFCDTNTIVYCACDNIDNPNYPYLHDLEQELLDIQSNCNQYGLDSLELIPIYVPMMHYDSDNNLLPASYINFLIINNAVLVPTYGDDIYDQKAIDIIQDLFPDREVIGINSETPIRQGGSLHCLTMQIP